TVMYAKDMMNNGGACLALTYYGAQKWIPNYNVMGVAKAALESSIRYLAADLGPFGIRVNAISAGPVRTLAASGIAGFRKMINNYRRYSPMRKDTTQYDVA
ncbi:MAG: enoyl-[acyl-carrier-protein] reductase FabI, partial [Phototrophicales bacterium]